MKFSGHLKYSYTVIMYHATWTPESYLEYTVWGSEHVASFLLKTMHGQCKQLTWMAYVCNKTGTVVYCNF